MLSKEHLRDGRGRTYSLFEDRIMLRFDPILTAAWLEAREQGS